MIELTTEEPQKNKTHKWRLYWFHESDLDASYPADDKTLEKAGFVPQQQLTEAKARITELTQAWPHMAENLKAANALASEQRERAEAAERRELAEAEQYQQARVEELKSRELLAAERAKREPLCAVARDYLEGLRAARHTLTPLEEAAWEICQDQSTPAAPAEGGQTEPKDESHLDVLIRSASELLNEVQKCNPDMPFGSLRTAWKNLQASVIWHRREGAKATEGSEWVLKSSLDHEAAARIAAERKVRELEAERAALVESNVALRNALNFDRTGLAAALNHVRGIVSGYQWIADGHWGSYDYTEHTVETLQREVKNLIEGVRSAAKRALRASGDRATAALRAQPSPPCAPQDSSPSGQKAESNESGNDRSSVGQGPRKLDADEANGGRDDAQAGKRGGADGALLGAERGGEGTGPRDGSDGAVSGGGTGAAQVTKIDDGEAGQVFAEFVTERKEQLSRAYDSPLTQEANGYVPRQLCLEHASPDCRACSTAPTGSTAGTAKGFRVGDRVRNALVSTDLGTVVNEHESLLKFGVPVHWDTSPAGKHHFVSAGQLELANPSPPPASPVQTSEGGLIAALRNVLAGKPITVDGFGRRLIAELSVAEELERK